MNSKDVKRLPAISADGEKLGEVERALLDPRRRQIVGFAITTGGGFLAPESGLIADTVEVQTLGSGALTLVSATPAGADSGRRYGELVDLDALNGCDVFSEAGVRLGHVSATTFDERTFTLAAIVVSPGGRHHEEEIPVDQVVTIGAELVVVAKDAGAPSVEPVASPAPSA